VVWSVAVAATTTTTRGPAVGTWPGRPQPCVGAGVTSGRTYPVTRRWWLATYRRTMRAHTVASVRRGERDLTTSLAPGTTAGSRPRRSAPLESALDERTDIDLWVEGVPWQILQNGTLACPRGAPTAPLRHLNSPHSHFTPGGSRDRDVDVVAPGPELVMNRSSVRFR